MYGMTFHIQCQSHFDMTCHQHFFYVSNRTIEKARSQLLNYCKAIPTSFAALHMKLELRDSAVLVADREPENNC